MAAETLEEKLTVLEIGAGKDYKRAQVMAERHPNWTYIAVDPDISWHAESPLPNLKIIPRSVPQAFDYITDKVDRVEMYHLGVPFSYKRDDRNGIDMKVSSKVYTWMNDAHKWHPGEIGFIQVGFQLIQRVL